MNKIITNLVQIIVIWVLGLTAMEANAQSIAFAYKGDWSSWMPICGSGLDWNSSRWGGDELSISRYTNMSGIILKSAGGREIFSFQITNFRLPDKKERKAHEKSGQWFSFYGTVDYYVNDEYPTAEALAKGNCLVIPNPRTDKTPSVKRHTVCEIRIAPFKKDPQVWNLFFDGIGIGISTQGLKFK